MKPQGLEASTLRKDGRTPIADTWMSRRGPLLNIARKEGGQRTEQRANAPWVILSQF